MTQKMKVLIALFTFSFVPFAISFNFKSFGTTFTDFIREFGKVYKDEIEMRIARQAFSSNVAMISFTNTIPGLGYRLGLNEYADRTFDTFRENLLGIIFPSDLSERGNRVENSGDRGVQMRSETESYTQVTAPASVDYRNYSMPVQNQMNCGSCWAFVVLGILESRMMIMNPSYNTVLSEQFLVDCDTRDYACNGGWPINALNYITKLAENGVPAMTKYQYYGFKTRCRAAVPKIPMNIKATVQNHTAGNEDMLKEIVAINGPVAAVISATSHFQLYKSGIFYDSTCSSNCSSVNHAVIIVGYGTNMATNLDYWIVRNSWGKSWGEQGYAYMSRNKGNNCNIACYAMYVL